MSTAGSHTFVAVIVNPKAGGGEAARHLARVERELGKAGCEYRVLTTTCSGDATHRANQARATGASVIAVIGGDGTLNEVSQTYLDDESRPIEGPPVAVLGAGTGNDFKRVLEGPEPTSMARAIARLMNPRTRAVDLGLITLRDARGAELRRVFVNVASVGVSGRVNQLVARSPRCLGGRAAFLFASIAALMTYRNVPLDIHLDGCPWYSGRTYLTSIANGQFCAAGLRIAPQASIDDGFLDVVCLADLSRRQMITIGSQIQQGKHLRAPGVHAARASRVDIRTPQHSLLVDMDGEAPGYSPMIVQVVPRAMQVVVA